MLLTGAVLALLLPNLAGAADEPTAKSVQTNLDYIWTLVAAALVFFMQAGFAMVETGFTYTNNAVNIIMKNLMDFAWVHFFSGQSALA